ncbi:MAG: mandelate racemase/muconate lactonizing enzyme family protein [Vicinamibacterales bacterium]
MTRIARATAAVHHHTLAQPVGGSGVGAVDLIVVELEDSAGACGLGFSYVIGGHGSAAVLACVEEQLARHVRSRTVPPPRVLWRQIASGFNRTGTGPNLVALAAIDLAAWDLAARSRARPLAEILGGAGRSVPVYGSGGFRPGQSPAEAVEVALAHGARGLRGVKPRVQGAPADAVLLGALRRALPDGLHLMLDANEKCDLPAARWLLHAARDHGVLFVEEPLPADMVAGYRSLAAGGGASMAAGEHLQGRSAFLPFVAEGLVSVVQPDLAMAGGLTPILDLAVLAEAFGVALAPHFLPGLFVHLAAAAPALTWLEEFPLLEPLFEGWPVLDPHGCLRPPDVPGHGLVLAPEVRAQLA